MKTTYDRWPAASRLARGLLNGERVCMAYQVRGLARWQLARRLGLATATVRAREVGCHFWSAEEAVRLVAVTNFPLAFFIQDDLPAFLSATAGPTFLCGGLGTDEAYCEVRDGN